MTKFIDIGANLLDAMYTGVYNGSKKHEPDLKDVLHRSWSNGLNKIIITAGNLEESKNALSLSTSDERLYSTVGCHPTRCLEFEDNPEEYLAQLKDVASANRNKIVAIGECGLDYDRTQFCPIDVQKRYFEKQIHLAQSLNLPLFLHCRNAADDLYAILSKYQNLRGVVHSFDGTIDEANRFMELGYYIGLNGCSLKTKENLETVAQLPSNRVLLETDCPWCEIRPTHAGYGYVKEENRSHPSVKKEKWKADCLIKSRNEPMNIRQVLDVLAALKKEDPSEIGEVIYRNSEELFFENGKK
ncbi:hypothetical protein PPYR_06526 [Photinus pyralis]|uniref:Deoxyribonuclease TATDN1 n=2 Tax=Photinus pyralis TaxID=7054 RepID=A0A1Y1LYK0_PHOPY|nr:putative deoxyribonuclease TATDN1 [Photinus pyralis]XP_031338355.1 putative deoxyribonuclease TATDN1 [Photinus pyralis]KAB0800787.1 hypothetical protein PPYR_06526 [Photinus pyralis]